MKKILSLLCFVSLTALCSAQFTLTYNGDAVENGTTATLSTQSRGDEGNEDAIMNMVLTNNGDVTMRWTIITEAPSGNTFSVSSVCGNMCNPGTQSNVSADAGESKAIQIHFSVPAETESGTTENFTVRLYNRDTEEDDLTFTLALTYEAEIPGPQFTLTYNGDAVENGTTATLSTQSRGDEGNEDAIMNMVLTNNGDVTMRWTIITEAPSGNTFSVSSVCGNMCNPGTQSNVSADAGESKAIQIHFSVPAETESGTTENFTVRLYNRDTEVDDLTFTLALTYDGVGNSSIAAVDNTANFSAYPNPATDMATIGYQVEGGATLIVTDIAGRKIIEQPVSGCGTLNLDVKQLHTGVYLYGIRQGNKQYGMKKLVVK